MRMRSMANEAQIGTVNTFHIWIRKPDGKSGEKKSNGP
jgi:hypothetical protein